MDMAERDTKETDCGVLRMTLSSWSKFVEYIFARGEHDQKDGEDQRLRIEDYVWRGHRSSLWRLDSAFDRKKAGSRDDILGEHRRCFAYAARGRLREFGLSISELKDLIQRGILSENHLWALGQHHGLATPLLDWSTSPFVAAYFAFEEPSRLEDVDWEETAKGLPDGWDTIRDKLQTKDKLDEFQYHDRVVFGLNYREVCKHTSLRYFSPLSSEHPRLVTQRGLFTFAEDGVDIETSVRTNWHKDGNHPWLIKIDIPNGQREAFLRGLNLMNINRATLLPDIDGAARFCNLGLEFPGYSALPGAV